MEITDMIDKIISSYDGDPYNLEISDAITVYSMFYLIDSSLFNKNTYTICDTALFSAYFCKNYLKTLNAPTGRINYLFIVIKENLTKAVSSYFNIPQDTVKHIFYRRSAFYNELFKDFNRSSIQYVANELELLIQYDLVYNEYVEFTLKSPLLIIDFEKQVQIAVEVAAYIRSFGKALKNSLLEYGIIKEKPRNVSDFPKQTAKSTSLNSANISSDTKLKMEIFEENTRRKRIISISAAVLILIAFIVGVIILSSVCFHSFSEPTCTQPAICSKCGLTKGAPLGHEWQDATCTTDQVCLRCGMTGTRAYGHNAKTAYENGPLICNECGEMIPYDLPESGKLFIWNTRPADSSITINNSSSNCFVKLKDVNYNDVFGFFVRADSSVTVDIPGDYYYVYFAYGDEWYGINALFGDDTFCQRDPDVADFYNYTQTYTLHKVENGNFSPETIDIDEF